MPAKQNTPIHASSQDPLRETRNRDGTSKRRAGDAKRKERIKQARGPGPWTPLLHRMTESPQWKLLSPHASKVHQVLLSKLNGYNNGNVSLPLAEWIEDYGGTKWGLRKGVKELVDKGFVIITRQGARRKIANLYALTCFAIDDVEGMDPNIVPTSKPLDLWLQEKFRCPPGNH